MVVVVEKQEEEEERGRRSNERADHWMITKYSLTHTAKTLYPFGDTKFLFIISRIHQRVARWAPACARNIAVIFIIIFIISARARALVIRREKRMKSVRGIFISRD